MLLALALLSAATLGQRIASSQLAISGSANQYEVKSAYFSEYQMVGAVTTIDVAANFGFSFTASVANVESSTNSCTILATVALTTSLYSALKLRFVLVSNSLNIRTFELNVSSSSAIIPVPSAAQPNWAGTNSVQGLLRGWSQLLVTPTSITLSVINVTHINVASSLASGWLLYQILIFRASDWSLSTGNSDQSLPKLASQIYGFTAAAYTSAALQCDSTACKAILNSSGNSYCLLSSNQTDAQYSPPSIPQINWIMITLVSISGLVFLLLLVPTIRYARNYFCPEVMNPAVSPEAELQETNDQVAVKAMRFNLINRPAGHDSTIRCCICLDAQANCIMQPCGHDNYCQSCVAYISRNSNQCPVCRTEVERIEFFENKPEGSSETTPAGEQL